jgi:hypothetical protein
MSFSEMFAANGWKPFQSCDQQVFSYCFIEAMSPNLRQWVITPTRQKSDLLREHFQRTIFGRLK